MPLLSYLANLSPKTYDLVVGWPLDSSRPFFSAVKLRRSNTLMQANSAHARALDGVVRGLLESSGLPVTAEVSAGSFPDEFAAGSLYVSAFVSDDLARDQVAVNVGTVLKSHLLVSAHELEGRSADELSERLRTFVHGGLRQLRGRLLELADSLGQAIDRESIKSAPDGSVVALPCSKCGGFGTVLVRRDGRHVAPGGCLGGRDVVGASYVPCHCAAGEALRRELAEPEKREPLIRQELDADTPQNRLVYQGGEWPLLDDLVLVSFDGLEAVCIVQMIDLKAGSVKVMPISGFGEVPPWPPCWRRIQDCRLDRRAETPSGWDHMIYGDAVPPRGLDATP